MTAPTTEDLAAFEDLISRLPADRQAAIGRARAHYNEDLPEARDEAGEPIVPRPGTIETDAGYWCFVFDRANESYLAQYPEGA